MMGLEVSGCMGGTAIRRSESLMEWNGYVKGF